MRTSSIGTVAVAYDAILDQFVPSADLHLLNDGTLLTTHAGVPVDGVEGTGFGVTTVLYVKTAGKVLYRNTGTSDVPAWVLAGGTDRSGAGAPEDGVTAGDLGDYYSDTTAYGGDPTTGWYVCTDGDLDTWAAVVVLSGAGVPVNGVVGTGANLGADILLDYTNQKLYIAGGTASEPTWTLA